MTIYKITNLVNNKIYIGQTKKSAELRFKEHCKPNIKRPCRLIHAAIKKYEPKNFIVEIIDTANSKEELNKKETFWIKHLGAFGKKGYNLTLGGDCQSITMETKARISNALKGKPNGRKGIPSKTVPWNKGKPWSPEMKEKLSASHLGQKAWSKGLSFTESHKLKLSLAKLGKPRPDRYKPIVCVETGEVFPSLKEAAAKLKLQSSKICNVLKGSRRHTGGFTFKYRG